MTFTDWLRIAAAIVVGILGIILLLGMAVVFIFVWPLVLVLFLF